MQAIKKLYDVIYADPPWPYDTNNLKRFGVIDIGNHYPTLSEEQLGQIQVPAKENSILWMWATAPKLNVALRVMAAWDFRYITNAVWDKTYCMIGCWFKSQHELLLIGKRGKFVPPPPQLRMASIIRIKKGKHSEKPFFIRDYLTKLYPDKDKIELFARFDDYLFKQELIEKGWTFWGNEA